MKSNLLKVLAFLLTLTMLLSLAACKPKKDNNKKPNKSDSQVDGSLSDGVGDIDTDLDEEIEIIISRPTLNLGISTGVKLDYISGEEEEEIGEEVEDEDLGDISEDEDVTYVSPVSKFGESVKGNIRTFSVKNAKSGIIHKDFQGLGCNVFPTMLSLESQQKADENIAYIELVSKRFNDISPSYARSWFQIDWMVPNYTNGDHDKYKDDPEQNPDYIAYSKGEYDFDNDHIYSCIEYWRMLGDAGTRVELAFGWKVAERIQDWFGEDPSRPRISAPKDLKRYADAAKALLIYCYDQGLRNMDILSYYNEPHRVENSGWHDSWDYATLGDKRVYWGEMATLARKELDSDKRTKNVEIWGTEPAGTINLFTPEYMNVYLYQHYSDIVDVFTFHEYYAGHLGKTYSEGMYSNFYDACAKARGFYKNTTLAVTEFFAADRDVPETVWGYAWYKYGGWNSSYASYVIALANNGWHTGFSWGYTGGYIGDPTNFMVGEGEHVAWSAPNNLETAADVRYNFYHMSMLNNYIPEHANVHNMTYTGEDLHSAAFTSEDGKDFALLVEKNEGGKALEFKVNLQQSLGGKDINVFRFVYEESTRNTDRNIQATIPELYDTIKGVNKRFSYKEDSTANGRYAIYIFTTLEPLAQIELYDAATGKQAVASELNLADGNSITINSHLIDCKSETVEWEIKQYSVLPDNSKNPQIDKRKVKNADLGTLTKNGNSVTYTAAADAKNGDIIALRAKIKGTNRFASAIIEIVKE